MKLTLKRVKEDEFGTHGILNDQDGFLICYTLELPWKDNQENVSCIPIGIYDVVPNNAEKPWRLLNVQGRTQIDIHAGNFMSDTLGCILVGLQSIRNGILQSQLAIEKLRHIVPEKFQLEILPIKG